MTLFYSMAAFALPASITPGPVNVVALGSGAFCPAFAMSLVPQSDSSSCSLVWGLVCTNCCNVCLL